jgi:catechol 2,3-dioxygenase-like lactoylglutathione lyase family enzyme
MLPAGPEKGAQQMFSHVMVGADDVEASKRFYDAALGALGIPPGRIDDHGRVFYMTRTGVFAITKPINGEPASCANGSTIGFAANSPEDADAWHQAGQAHGGTPCEDPPGVREGKLGKLYLAYLRDPAGNKVCALHRMPA